MPYGAGEHDAGHRRARAMEKNDYNDGKTKSGARVFTGPASRHGVAKTNPTKSGGINRPLKSDGY